MCGIAGIVGHLSSSNRAALKRMNDAMVHRGPDGEGFWESEPDSRQWGAMLGHRRLAILDLTPSGAQPMVDRVSGDVAVQNGEIYNYVELRSQLAALGHHVDSSGDAAVMLRALSVFGAAAVQNMRGMFAFAYWNVQARELMLARDALGIKPLYIARNPDSNGAWSIAFASEVRAILESGLLAERRLNPAAVESIVWNGFTVAPETAVVGIESLWPGERISFSGTGLEISRERHWSMPESGVAKTDDERIFAAELEQSVQLHLASDVPLGVFLSGGVDSSAIANLAQKSSANQIHTFTLAFEEAERNEGNFARQVAQAIGTQHQEFVLTQRYFLDHLDIALDSVDQPTFDGLNSYFMSMAVREAGFKVALVGSGGDELFGGYKSFRDLPILQRLARLSGMLPVALKEAGASTISKLLNQTGRAFPPQTRWAKLPDVIRNDDDILGLYQLAYALFLPSFQSELLLQPLASSKSSIGLPLSMREQLLKETRGKSSLEAISILEQRLFLGERLLRDTDAASMAASIETRLPLVDQRILTKANCLPEELRFQPLRRKELLRRIGLKGLPPQLFNRPKSGFELPFDQWMRSTLGDAIGETFNDRDAVRSAGLNPNAVLRLWNAFRTGTPGLYWSRVWALYVLVRWCRRHQVSI
jgi:asparagine synthase (glutamine-hydrolysing)